MRIVTAFALGGMALGFVGAPGPAYAAPFDIAGPAANNVDTNPATNVDLVTALTGTITDLNIELSMSRVFGIHPEEWSLTLTHGAISVVLKPIDFSHKFATTSFTVTLDDAAASLWLDNEGASGTFRPSNPLSAFNGLDLSGTWTLSFRDGTVADGDDLTAWRIFGTTAEVPEPASLALLAGGLLGLGLARRRR